jgi:hypothetical protein
LYLGCENEDSSGTLTLPGEAPFAPSGKVLCTLISAMQKKGDFCEFDRVQEGGVETPLPPTLYLTVIDRGAPQINQIDQDK